MKVNEIKGILNNYSLSPNRKFGQNFLVSGAAASEIAKTAAAHGKERILEIGPGLGAVTEKLLKTGFPVTAVEIDSGLCSYLRDRFGDNPSFRLIHSDFLKYTPEEKYDPVVSNLPYYCASEIIFKIAIDYSPETILVMMQREMAERLSAGPGTKAYGAFTVSLGFYYSPEILFDAGSGDFYPPPDVRSSFVRLRARKRAFLSTCETELFHLIVKSAFWARRKTLCGALSASPHRKFDRETVISIIDKAGFSRDIRGEELSIDEFVTLTKLWLDHEKNR